jgi:hypothetical protein
LDWTEHLELNRKIECRRPVDRETPRPLIQWNFKNDRVEKLGLGAPLPVIAQLAAEELVIGGSMKLEEEFTGLRDARRDLQAGLCEVRFLVRIISSSSEADTGYR